MVTKLIKHPRRRAHIRVRKKIAGTPAKPRLAVFRADRNIYAQIIDDLAGHTLVAASTLDPEFKKSAAGLSGATVAAAKLVGELLAKRALAAGLSKVCFDRGGRLYHGRVQALADGARAAGLEF